MESHKLSCKLCDTRAGGESSNARDARAVCAGGIRRVYVTSQPPVSTQAPAVAAEIGVCSGVHNLQHTPPMQQKKKRKQRKQTLIQHEKKTHTKYQFLMHLHMHTLEHIHSWFILAKEMIFHHCVVFHVHICLYTVKFKCNMVPQWGKSVALIYFVSSYFVYCASFVLYTATYLSMSPYSVRPHQRKYDDKKK